MLPPACAQSAAAATFPSGKPKRRFITPFCQTGKDRFRFRSVHRADHSVAIAMKPQTKRPDPKLPR
jgi:hypothetical protein